MDTLLTGDCKQRLLLGNAHNNRRTVFSVVCTAAMSGKQITKHVSVATDLNATIEESVFYVAHDKML
jgi:hypothetical protein